MSYSWKPIYREIVERLGSYQGRSRELVSIVDQMRSEGLKVIPSRDLDLKPGEAVEIDPFSFLSCFNRSIMVASRQQILAWLKHKWELNSEVPADFDGIPLMNAQRSWYCENRDVPIMWDFFSSLLPLEDANDLDVTLFDRCCRLPGVKQTSLTMGMFWTRPDLFFALDQKNLRKAESMGVAGKPATGLEYLDWMERLREKFSGDIASFSYDAHISNFKQPLAFPYSLLFRDFSHADEVLDVTNDALKALGYPDRQPNDEFLSLTIPKKSARNYMLRVNCGPWAAFTFRSWAGNYSYEVMVPEDHPLCDLSLNGWQKEQIDGKRYGWAVIPASDIEKFWPEIEPSLQTIGDFFRDRISNYRKSYQSTLLKLITEPDSRDAILRETLILNESNDPDPTDSSYWWVSVEPTEFRFSELRSGQTIHLEAKTASGLRRSITDAFDSAKVGDAALIYIRAPQRFVWGSARVTSGLEQGDHLELQIEKVLDTPILVETFSEHPELADCKALKFRKGTLCRLQEEEFEIIAGDAFPKEGTDPFSGLPAEITRQYAMKDALSDLFVDEERLQLLLSVLRRKKNIVLQGAPGTGKTFIARRLAYLLLGEKDETRVATTQFHPTTSYEDFVQGFRPDENGDFRLRNGMFYKFCRQAQAQPNQPHVFIIDEINRGNLSKILGELMLLIETDKRSLEYAVPLTYSGDTSETFYVPDNVYLIGTMNTADRSLSLVDYALRRRFSFVELIPGFDSPRFDSVLADMGVSVETIMKLKSRMVRLNILIASDERSLGRGFCIGHSFFVPSEKIVDGAAWLREVMEYEIVPLLEEYWVDDSKKLAEALAIARG
jgi:hypothetical protein